MEKNISGTGDSICKAFEFRKNLRVLRDERRAKVSGARRNAGQGEAEERNERLSPEVDASPSTMEMNSTLQSELAAAMSELICFVLRPWPIDLFNYLNINSFNIE